MIAERLHDDEPEPAELPIHLTELAERYLAVVGVPDELAALRRAYAEQGLALVRLLLRLDELEARLRRLERRP